MFSLAHFNNTGSSSKMSSAGITFSIIVSSYAFSIYYILKAIILYTKERRDYLKSLSDIKEIVDIKPTKKEAKKREKN